MEVLNALTFAVMAALHAWVTWELWTGQSACRVRLGSDPMGWFLGAWEHVHRADEPTLYWLTWCFKAGILAVFWLGELLWDV